MWSSFPHVRGESAQTQSARIEGLETRKLFAASPARPVPPPPEPNHDAVLDWNAIALQAVADDHTPWIVPTPDQGGPTRTARALAVVHAAIYDAVNSIAGGYEPYLVSMPSAKYTSVDAAVAQAGHDTLVAMFPKQAAVFDAALEESLAQVPDGRGKGPGVAVGRYVARAILRAREDDGSAGPWDYTAPSEAGVYQPWPGEPAPLTPGWGDVTPFTMTDGDQFPAPPPPAMDSPEYAAAYNEVKDFGGDGVNTPTLRTDEQTEIGIYWGYDGPPGLGTPPRLYNQIARVVAEQEGNTEVENARLFALVNLTMADAGVASWGTKYIYNVWRPLRGICQLDSDGNSMDDGNPLTAADADWKPLGAPYTNGQPGSSNFTPPFPAYTSGHATFGAAFFKTMERFYGTDAVPFTFVSDEFNGVNRDVNGEVRPLRSRSFATFSQAAEENGQSRIYLGVHWAFDKTAGMAQGNGIADHAYDNYLRPTTPEDPQGPPVAASQTIDSATVDEWRTAVRDAIASLFGTASPA